MRQQILTVDSTPRLIADNISGDLRVAGWERSEVMAKTDGDNLELTVDGKDVFVNCDEDLILYLPKTADLKFDNVAGDASLQVLMGRIEMEKIAGDMVIHDAGDIVLGSISGDLTLRKTGGISIDSISGDLVLRGSKSNCQISSIGGDASIRDVEGSVLIDNIGSDLFLRNVRGSVVVSTGSDATIHLQPHEGMDYQINAGDDLLLRLPPDSDAVLIMTASSPDSIHVIDFPNVQMDPGSSEQVVTLGKGGVKMLLTASDDLVVTSKDSEWDSAAEFGINMGDFEWPHIPEIPPIPPLPSDFQERINQRVERAMERARLHTESASRHAERARMHAEASSRRAELKMEAAMRRAEAKMRSVERRFKGPFFSGSPRGFGFDSQGTPPAEPVSDEERLTILRLLQEKKVSLQEAEELLSALEGRAYKSPAESQEPLDEVASEVNAEKLATELTGEEADAAPKNSAVQATDEAPPAEELEALPVAKKKKKPKKEARND